MLDKKTQDFLLILGGALNAFDERMKTQEKPVVENQENVYGAKENPKEVNQAEDPLSLLRQLLEGKHTTESKEQAPSGHAKLHHAPTMIDILSLLSHVLGSEQKSQHDLQDEIVREHNNGMKMSLIAENLVRMGYTVAPGERSHMMDVFAENELLVSLSFEQDGLVNKNEKYKNNAYLNKLKLAKDNARDEMKTALNMGLEDNVLVDLTEKFNDCLYELKRYQESLERKRSMVKQIETLVMEIEKSL